MTDLPALRPAPMELMVDPMGSIMANSGRHLRNAVAAAFEMIGGTQALAEWAQTNKGDFYTKLMPKLIVKEIQVDDRRSIDDMVLELDGVALPPRKEAEKVVDADWESPEDYE